MWWKARSATARGAAKLAEPPAVLVEELSQVRSSECDVAHKDCLS